LQASLSHTCIVAYHEAFADAGKLCVVTELVRGGDLGSLIA
jgi:NIMA (never in mitosis gene a)-related kinase